MKNLLSIIKSSFHDIRCCDETQTDQLTAWRLLVSSLSCVLDQNGKNTGYVHGATLQEYTIADSLPTGETKPNLPSDPNHISDYSDTNMCAIQQEVQQTAFLNASNSCSGILSIALTNQNTFEGFNIDVNAGQSITINVPPGTYRAILHVGQNQPAAPAPALHIAMTVNADFQVAISESLKQFENVATNMNISVRPTTQALT